MMKNNKVEKALISIVIPVYNTEKFLKKCLDSIVNQTYSNLEIIVVNDASPGDTKSIVEGYSMIDNRVKYIEHEKNKGLFHARVTGSELATGDYIAFVDSDDYVSIDYYRLLIEKAVNEQADIVEGRIIREHEDGHKFIQNYNNILLEELTGTEISNKFFSQEGLFYHWHVIWNKIYSKKLWDKCLPHYKKQNKHLIMTEDLAFSSLLFLNAEKYSSIEYDGYFYYIRAEASTGSSSDLNKFIKNFNDMATAFEFVENYLKEVEKYRLYGEHLQMWKRRYYRLWASRLATDNIPMVMKNKAMDELKKALKFNEEEYSQPEDHYHSLINTPWEGRYEKIKKLIASKEIEYVSFDIFDTLVVRPFFDPRDLLNLIDEYFHEIVPNSELTSFKKIRLQAEERARQLIKVQNLSWQDINLNEIYEHIDREYDIDSDVVEKLKKKEIELELRFTSKRDSVYELYKMARALNKKVIFVSDMYLSKETVKQIVEKEGYTDYHKLYVSSDTRQLKNSGNMFSFVSNDLSADPSSILHIGDNWNSDKVMAEKQGWKGFFIAKTTDLLLNRLSDKESGNSVNKLDHVKRTQWINFEYLNYFSTRCMFAVIANKIFDNPYVSFNSDSDFNADPYFIGYYALGMHTFGLSKWIIEDSIAKNHETVHFMARDGYLPQMVFDAVTKHYTNGPKSNYIYASRKSLLPYLFSSNNKYDLTSFVSLYAHSPESILELFGDIIKDEVKNGQLNDESIMLSKKFSCQHEFKNFLDKLCKEYIDLDKVKEYHGLMERYFNDTIGENDATFDLGYSARLQTIIVNIMKRKCDTYFVHTNNELPWKYSRQNGFTINSFYDFKPNVSGILREHMFAELSPSCIGYANSEDGTVKPVFEEYYSNDINKLMVNMLQKGAVDFAENMMSVFGEYVPKMKIRNKEVSLPLEMYIHNSKQSDRAIFLHSYSDDTVHGGNAQNNILNWWNRETNKLAGGVYQEPGVQYHINNDFLQKHSSLSKLVFYMLFDRDTLKIKVKNRYAGKPKTLRFITSSYKGLRGIKRKIVN